MIVDLRLHNAGKATQVAVLHRGTCARFEPAKDDRIWKVVNGRSTTTFRHVLLQTLMNHPYAIYVTRSVTAPQPVSCADV